jgi:tRNA 2-thiouridine synthesizing protein A
MKKVELDAKGLLCPMPVIKTQNKIKELQPGDILEVVSTDPGVSQDIPAWCRINGHRIIKILESTYEICIQIEVGSG